MPVTTTIRMDEKLKKQTQEKLDALGLNFNTFVVMAAKQLVAQNKIPFSLEVPEPEEIPTDTTLQAMARATKWANSPLDTNEVTYTSADDLFDALDAKAEDA